MSRTKSIPESGRDPSPDQDSVTLLLTDIVGSTQLLDVLGGSYPQVVIRSRELLREAILRHGGTEVESPGDGFFAVFTRPTHASDSVHAAVEVQRALGAQQWPSGAAVGMRMGVHTGRADLIDGSYFGMDVHRTARIAAVASGGQVVLSLATRGLITAGELPEGVSIRDLGSHRLKDLRYPEILFDLSIAGLPDSAGSLKSVNVRPNNLPTPPTTFIGREQQLQEICALLLRSDTSLLTLTGAGGSGKTRLAIESGRRLLGNFLHGVYMVHLAPLSDAGMFPSAIVQALGVPEFATTAPLDSLKHHLAQRETMLILDNFEHLVDGADDILQLLHHCPALKILVTSRETLSLRLEREFVVAPLQLPDRAMRVEAESLKSIESVQLFTERVRVYDRSFTVTSENAPAISAICRRLDGLPLALELAASWLKLFTPQALLHKLQTGTEFLGGGPRDLERHQRTLKDAIAWSYDLLSDNERFVFRRLAVFAGGCTTDSAIAIASKEPRDGDILLHLMSLTRKSLVIQTSAEGEKRLGMLETIRHFGKTQLEASSENSEVRQRHAEHYLGLAEKLAPGLVGREQRRFVTPLLAEQDNLRAGLAWAIEQGDAAITSRFLRALLWLWIPRGQFSEGRAWARRACDRFADLGAIREVAVMFDAAGWLEILGGNYPAALPLIQRSFQIFEALPDVGERVRANVTLGVTSLVLGDETGASLCDQAVTLSRTIADSGSSALALLSAGIKHQVCGNAEGASTCYEQSLAAFYKSDNVFWPGQVLQNLALLRLQEGDWERAGALAAEAFEIGREYDYPMIRNLALAVMGGVSVAKGAPLLAAQFFGVVDASLGDLGVAFEPPEHATMQANIETAKTLMGPQNYADAFDQGRCWVESDLAAAVLALVSEPASAASAKAAHP